LVDGHPVKSRTAAGRELAGRVDRPNAASGVGEVDGPAPIDDDARAWMSESCCCRADDQQYGDQSISHGDTPMVDGLRTRLLTRVRGEGSASGRALAPRSGERVAEGRVRGACFPFRYYSPALHDHTSRVSRGVTRKTLVPSVRSCDSGSRRS